MRLTAIAFLAACASIPCGAADASARVRHHVRHAVPAPSADTVELGILAPPSPLSTLTQTYGDAAFARLRLQGRIACDARHDAKTAAQVGVPYPCDPSVARSEADICRNDPRVTGYGQYYAYTPAYVSAPQGVAVDPGAQSPLLSPATALFWAVNGLRPDAHD